MRIKLFTLIIGLLPIFLSAQNDVESLIKAGIERFEEGKYQQAIDLYEKALKIDKDNTAAIYEIGYAYYALNDYDKAIKYADKVIKMDKGELAAAYTLKGNILDDMGKTDKAIKAYEEGIKKSPDNYLLHFNLAMSHTRLNDFAAAETSFLNAIGINVTHGSSHYHLGRIKAATKERVPSILSLYFFLLLEPTGERATAAYELLQTQLAQGVGKTDAGNIEIQLTPEQIESEYSSVEMMLGLLAASPELIFTEDKSPEGKFTYTTNMIFSKMAENKAGKSGFYWEGYVPLFEKIKDSGHIKTFCYYISQSKSPAAAKWVEDNAEAVDAFFKALNEN